MADIFPFWAGNLPAIATFLVVAFAITHTALWFRRSPRLHFWFNYGALLLGGLSLISTALQSRVTLAAWTYDLTTPRYEYQRREIGDSLDRAADLLCGSKFVKSDSSPSDFDDLVRQQARACAMVSRIKGTPAWITTSDDAIAVPEVGQKAISDPWAKQFFGWIDNAVSEYNITARERRELVQKRATSPIDIELAVVGPYLAVLAFALASAAMLVPAGPRIRRRSRRPSDEPERGPSNSA